MGHFATLHYVAPAKLAAAISLQKLNSIVDRPKSLPAHQRNKKRSSDVSLVPPPKFLANVRGAEGVSRLRPLISGLSPWRPGFDRRPLLVVFAVDIVALGRFFSEYFDPPALEVSFD